MARNILLLGMGRGGVDVRYLKGINQFRRGLGNWLLIDSGHRREKLRRWIDGTQPETWDGVIGHVLDAEALAQVRQLGLPTVDLSGSTAAEELCQVKVDGEAVGRMAHRHFQSRHYASHLYVSNGVRSFELERWRGYEAAVRRDLRQALWCALDPGLVAESDRAGVSELRIAGLEGLLAELPKPVAVFAATDHVGTTVCDWARRRGLRVPEDVAVLGVDDFEPVCESCEPPLSSIQYPAEHMGFEAARRLDSMMRGEDGVEGLVFDPSHVHARASTELSAVGDPAVASAIAFMRDHLSEPLSIDQIADHVHMHRRTFLRHFHKAIGRNPSEELLRMRLEMARMRLSEGGDSVYEIALDCGFGSSAQLSRHFKRENGLTPSEFRSFPGKRG